MKFKFLTGFWLLFSSIDVHGQIADTIFTYKERIGGEVKEVGLDFIKYSYPNEELINILPVSQIQKIIFRSGRIQNFSSFTPEMLQQVRYVVDWEKIVVTKNTNDVVGLKPYNALGLNYWTKNYFNGLDLSVNEVQEQILNYLKKVAAARGYKVLLANQDNSVFKSLLSKSDVTVIPYADSISVLTRFKSKLGNKAQLNVRKRYVLNLKGIHTEKWESNLKIKQIYQKDGFVYLKGNIGGYIADFRLVYFGPDFFVVYYYGGNDGYGNEYNEYNFEISYE
jgi:hypothetical protein